MGHRTASSLVTSVSLIERAGKSDAVAWERLCRLYGPVIYDWAKNSGLQSQDASDVMQEVFATLMRNLPSFQKRTASDSFRGWLWTVTRNKVHDFHRKRQGSANATGGSTAMYRFNDLPDDPPSDMSVEGKQEASLLWSRAMALVQNDFEPQTWQAFWRTVVMGEQPAAVADDLGVSVWTVYKAKSRVLQRIRDEFNGVIDF